MHQVNEPPGESNGAVRLTAPHRLLLAGWHMSGGSGRMTIAKPDAAAVHTAAQQHACWLQDALALLLSSLVLDRFADYVSDQVTAPVREAAAQALALVAAELGSPACSAAAATRVAPVPRPLGGVRSRM